MIEQQITQQWSKLLPFVMNVINNTPPPGAKNTPFEIVFGQTRKTDSHFYDTLANLGIKNEEDIPEELLNRQNSIIANQKNDNQTLEMYDPSVMWKNFYTS